MKNIYRDYLLADGVKDEQIISIELELAKMNYLKSLFTEVYIKKAENYFFS